MRWRPPASRNSAAGWLPAIVGLDMIGFGMLIPDIQLRAEHYGAPGWAIGGILASTFLVQAVASPLWGKVADATSHKLVLATCGALSALSMGVYAIATDPALMLASRIVAGIGAANVAMALAIASNSVGEEERPKALGRISAGMTLGLIAGPALGGWIAHAYGQMSLGLIAAGLSAIGLGFIPFVRPAPVRAESASGEAREKLRMRAAPGFARLLVVATVGWLSLALLEGTFGRLIKAQLGMGSLEFGLIFGWESLVAFAVQALGVGVLLRLGSPRTLLAFSLLAIGAGVSVMPWAPSFAVLLTLGTVYALGVGAGTPMLNELVSRMSPEGSRGSAFGSIQSARSVGFIVGPVVGGMLFDRMHALPYVLAGVVCFIAALLAASLPRADAHHRQASQ